MWRWISIVALVFWGPLAKGVSEAEFATVFPSKILPYWESEGRSNFLTTKDGVKLHYRSFVKPGQTQALIISPGRTESTFKYAEVVWDLRDLDFAIYIIDHRGQGASSRLVPDPQLQYVQYFRDYVDDMAFFYDQVVKPAGYQRVQGLAHSMGANIMANFAIDHPEALAGFVMSSPMLDIPPGPLFHEKIAYAVISFLSWIGFDKSYVFGQTPFDENESYRGTSSVVRYRAFHELRKQNKAEQVGGVSYRWVKEALEATWYMRKHAPRLQLPILLMQAGSDEVVLTGGQDQVCRLAANCRKVAFPEARHELFMESDSMRETWLAETRTFLTKP